MALAVAVLATLAFAGSAGAQTTSGAKAATAAAQNARATAVTNSQRFVASCQQAIERGQVGAGCQGPLYSSEIARLKKEALQTKNPNLLTLLGDAYQSNRSGISDISQAYRWYLLGAVRGDPRAMQRLSDLYQNGQGTQQDDVKALGYARLTQRLAPAGSASAQGAAKTVRKLSRKLAAEDIALADQFANDLEAQLRKQGLPANAPEPSADANSAAQPVAAPRSASKLSQLPGMGGTQLQPVMPMAPSASTSGSATWAPPVSPGPASPAPAAPAFSAPSSLNGLPGQSSLQSISAQDQP